MATQMQLAREGKITGAMEQAAKRERLSAEELRERIARGTVALCANINHKALKPCAVGEGLATKVNANIGTSSTYPSVTTPKPRAATSSHVSPATWPTSRKA